MGPLLCAFNVTIKGLKAKALMNINNSAAYTSHIPDQQRFTVSVVHGSRCNGQL